jgi:hypothetical protein
MHANTEISRIAIVGTSLRGEPPRVSTGTVKKRKQSRNERKRILDADNQSGQDSPPFTSYPCACARPFRWALPEI